MNVLTGRRIPRRTFLQSVGATVAVPLLDAMLPAGPQAGRTMSEVDARPRLICIEEVHGTAGCSDWGAKQFLFAPQTIGTNFTLHQQNVLSPLQGFQDHMTIVSNTDCREAEAYQSPEVGGDHFRSTAVFLTQCHPKQTQGSDIFAGVSLDQMHAQRFGQDTALPSLQLCIENLGQGGGCWYNYHCAYTDAMSWATPTEPLPMIRDPRAAFDLLFGAGGTAEERTVRRRTNKSILDWIAGEVASLKLRLGAADSYRLDQYLEDIREVERRIAKVEEFNRSGEQRELPEAPSGVPDSFAEHMQLMFDLQVLALQTDMTKVVAFKIGRDASNRIHTEAGTDTPFHPGSHHGNSPEKILDFNKICQYRTGQLAYFLEKLKASTEGDSNLLEKSLIIWGSPMSDGNIHNHRRCPLVLFGRAHGKLKGNLHLKALDGTPMANVFLTLMHKLGHDDLESFGDSTGELALEAPVSTVSNAL